MTPARAKFNLACLVVMTLVGVADITLALSRQPIPYFRIVLGALFIAGGLDGIRRQRRRSR